MDAAATNSTGIQELHPLKGIINSNDDPMRCAVCSVFISDYNEITLRICCGRGICDSCSSVGREEKRCLLCKVPSDRKLKDRTACLKKQAKKGSAWAQVLVGTRYGAGDGLRRSFSEDFHWFREAAKRGHPMGMFFLGKAFLNGSVGCSVDLLQAQEYFEAAESASKSSIKGLEEECRKCLIQIAQHYVHEKSFERAKSILQPIAERGIGEAQTVLGTVLSVAHHDYRSALVWFTSAAFATYLGGVDEEKMRNTEHGAMLCCMWLQKYAQAKFWGKLTRTSLQAGIISSRSVRVARVTSLINLQRNLRAIRDVCGGCGAEFEGKERKFCRGCRTYCYCSRDCQKMHWNRKEGGHREDCKGAMELKQKMKEKKRAEAMGASVSK